jgi:predicted transcriptional regulator
MGPAMTLTVRLDDTLAQALERHCAATGATKSLVVQESLAVYLLAHRSPHRGQAAARGVAPSANARAFAEAGLLGAAALGAGPADKAAVRAQAWRRLQPKAG